MHRPVVIVVLALLAACGGRERFTVADPVACSVPGLPNCRQTGDIVFGAQPSPAALQYLRDQGVTTVVSTRGLMELDWDERALVESLGMRFVQIPMGNPVTGITDAQVAALDSVLSAPGSVLLHCSSGNRVAGLWGAWLAERQGMEPVNALRLAELAGMTRVRPAVEQRVCAAGDC
jgi:protein tyrosine phosphatase (PTP) superfamily phosphohydrolase (DUF442 family)